MQKYDIASNIRIRIEYPGRCEPEASILWQVDPYIEGTCVPLVQ